MEITKIVSGIFQTNTYVITKGETAAVIDPAGKAENILEKIEESGAKLCAVLLTHGHFDHTSAAAEIKEKTGAKIHIHEKDNVMLGDAEKSFAIIMPGAFKPCESDVILNDGVLLQLGELEIKVMHTPGHSGGSVMFITDNVIFSGDTLFEGSVGRIDGWSGDYSAQVNSLEKIKQMQGDYRILPGHGDETTLKKEKNGNPYLL
jgi:glyoxylase-like metal-dependent hydrolase (beta-lactamase superfamily II)